MLRIHTSTSAAVAKSYFSSADYYSEGQELVGAWRGKGARMLGFAGEVDQRSWDRLCDNRHPATGAALTPRRKAERRVGYDLTFDVPKSVSLLFGLTGDERLLDAFRESVDETMNELEAEAKSRVRMGGMNEDRATGNLVWGQYVHFTSRPVDGVPDPQLHAHCFVFNTTSDRREGRWKAAQLGGIKQDAPYFQAAADARLAHRLAELGLRGTCGDRVSRRMNQARSPTSAARSVAPRSRRGRRRRGRPCIGRRSTASSDPASSTNGVSSPNHSGAPSARRRSTPCGMSTPGRDSSSPIAMAAGW